MSTYLHTRAGEEGRGNTEEGIEGEGMRVRVKTRVRVRTRVERERKKKKTGKMTDKQTEDNDTHDKNRPKKSKK